MRWEPLFFHRIQKKIVCTQYKKTLFLKKKKNSFCKGERIRRKCLEINFIKKNLGKNVIMFVFLMRKKNLSLISEAYIPFKFLKVFAFMKVCNTYYLASDVLGRYPKHRFRILKVPRTKVGKLWLLNNGISSFFARYNYAWQKIKKKTVQHHAIASKNFFR